MRDIELHTWGKKQGEINFTHDAVIDCTSLPNPYLLQGLKNLDGRHQLVQDYVSASPEFKKVAEQMTKAASEGARIIVLTCVGGKHRSVAVAEMCAASPSRGDETCKVVHHHLEV